MAIFDIVLVAIILLCGLVGLRRGFILTLCSLLAVIVALVGARITANEFSPAVTDAIAPRIETVIAAQLEKSVDQTVEKMTDSDETNGGLTGILGLLQRGGLYNGAISDIRSAIQSGIRQTADSVASNMALQVARPVAWGLVYSAAFAVILLLWHLISLALNLVAKLPGLRTFNRLLGGACGLITGLVIVSIICCLILYIGLLPTDLCRQSVFLRIYSLFTGTSI